MPETMTCQFCGNEIPSDSQFCPNCGGSQEKPIEQPIKEMSTPPTPISQTPLPFSPASAPTAKKSNTLLIVGLVIAGLVIVCCVGLVLFNMMAGI